MVVFVFALALVWVLVASVICRDSEIISASLGVCLMMNSASGVACLIGAVPQYVRYWV